MFGEDKESLIKI